MYNIVKKIQVLITLLLTCLITCQAEVKNEGTKKWQQDLSNEMKIGLATEGYSRAVLECSSDWIAFVITLDKDFHGVIYSKGSFHIKNSPCFLDADGGTDFALKFSYEQCGIQHQADLQGYSTTVVVQHDKDLITPGDLAFKLVCKDEISVNATLEGMRSQISLVEADPGADSSLEGALTAMSPSNLVTLTPPKININSKQKREEL